MKDEALSPVPFLMEPLPIAKSDDALRAKVEAAAGRLIQLARQGQVACGDLLDWLRVQHQIALLAELRQFRKVVEVLDVHRGVDLRGEGPAFGQYTI